MDGARIHPGNLKEIYTKGCEAFINKLQCQIFVLLSRSPSPDMESIATRLEELSERIVQIGFLGEVGEFRVKDGNRVRARWGPLPIKEICFEIKWELAVVMEELANGGDSLILAEILVGILDALPF